VRTISAISKGASIGWAVVVVLLAAAAYEAAVALEWISLGSQPGDDPPGQAVVTIAAFLALLTGFVAAGIGQRVWRGRLATLVPVVAAAYMVVQYYTFDSYYLPSRTRFSDTGSALSMWVYGVAVAAVIVAFAISKRPSFARVLTPAVLLICGLMVASEGLGH
jgi:hypothetical protein